MRKLKTKTETVEVIDDILCNKCGKSTRLPESRCFSFVALDVLWGYGAAHDTEHHESHLCEGCYDELVATFDIPPTVKGRV